MVYDSKITSEVFKKNMVKFPKIGIVGVGMVGSQLERYFREVKKLSRGKRLFLYDIDPKKDYFDDVSRADVIFICVPTPRSPSGAANLSVVEAAISTIKGGKTVVIKSTVPPGTTERLQKKFSRHQIVFNPEFLTESRAWEDMLKPDRQIVGHTQRTKSTAAEVLRLLPEAYFKSPSLHGCYAGHYINATEAETGKIAANIFGATKVTFGNIMADFCAALTHHLQKQGIKTDAAYDNVRHILSHDGRIGPSWLDIDYGNYRGFGGYCFPKDLDAFLAYGDALVVQLLGHKDKDARDLAGILKKGLAVFGAIRSYNEALLNQQGLSVRQISTHEKDITLSRPV